MTSTKLKKWVAVFACLTLVACNEAFSPDETEARNELLQIAPLGSDARIALPILEEKGFKCSWNQQRPFAGLEGKHDYLYCDNKKLVGVFITRRWQLALIHKNYIVADAKFGIGLTGS